MSFFFFGFCFSCLYLDSAVDRDIGREIPLWIDGFEGVLLLLLLLYSGYGPMTVNRWNFSSHGLRPATKGGS